MSSDTAVMPVQPTGARAQGSTGRGNAELTVRRALGVAGGLAFGLSAFAFGFYDSALWGPAALVVLALAAALLIGTPRLPRGLQLAAIGALAALWLWAWASRGWSESAAQAQIEANRLALYTALLVALVAIVRRDDRVSAALLSACTAGVLIVLAVVLGRALSGDAGLFLYTRLNEPLGYVNAQADLLLLAFWPLVALGEQIRKPLRSGLGVGGAIAVLGAAVFAQSRGSIVGLAVSTLVLLALVPGRRRRLWVLLAAGATIALIWPELAGVYRHPDPITGGARSGALVSAGQAIVAAALGVGLAWGVVCAALHSLAQRRVVSGRALGRTSAALLATAAVVAAGVAVAEHGRISDYVSRQYHAFVKLDLSQTAVSGQSRLGSGGGYRYDYWRVAWKVFRDEPVHGVGAGNYDVPYFANRRQAEDIRQPHSIELQALSELGIPGGLALLALIGCATAGLVIRGRRGRHGRGSSRERALAVAAGGMFFLWLAHTSVDWMHLIPGLTAIALASLAVLVSPARQTPEPAERRPVRLAAVALALGLAVLASVAILRPVLSQHERSVARSLLVKNPSKAVAKANDAISLDGQEVRNWYVRSAALARLGLYAPARSSLERAVALEPRDWVTWFLLGDLAARRGDLCQARRDYRRALELNPRGGFGRFVRDPRAAVAWP